MADMNKIKPKWGKVRGDNDRVSSQVDGKNVDASKIDKGKDEERDGSIRDTQKTS